MAVPEGIAASTLREVVETLARLERPPCSPGEREAARWIADRLSAAGCDEVTLEDEAAWGPFPPTLTGLGLLGVIGASLVLRGRRVRGGTAALIALAGLIDEVQNGPRIVRKAVRSRRATVNVVARAGDMNAERTLVVLAHHDAAQTGYFFDQRWAQALFAAAPDLMGRVKTQPPQWWAGVAPQLLTIGAAIGGRRRLARAGLALGALVTAAVADIWRSPTVPGANDNLSAVAALVGVAELLQEQPAPGVRVLLVSCGAEESFQEGIRGFMARHRGELSPGRTWFLNLDTIGSTYLVMLEGEGPIWMEDYADPAFRDDIARCADESGIVLERGVRARASTDGIICSRAGYPTATLVSLTPWRMPANYHLMTDVPDNLDLATVAEAVRLTYAVVRRLGGTPATG